MPELGRDDKEKFSMLGPKSDFQVTPALVEAFDRDGAVKLERPFDDVWLDGLQETIMRNIRDNAETGESQCTVTTGPGRARVFNAVIHEPFAQKWAIESSAAEIAARVMGSKTARYYLDVTFCKMGGGEEEAKASRTGFHLDVSAFGFKGHHVPSFWLALTDVTPDDGPLVTALGSHKKVKSLYRTVYTTKPLIDGYLDNTAIYDFLNEEEFEMKTWPCQRGDVIMINPYLAHASVAMKRPDGLRLGMSTRFMGDDVRWSPNIYHEIEEEAHPYPITAGAMPPDEWFPRVWDAEAGNVAEKQKTFNAFAAIELKRGYHKAEPGYVIPETFE